MTVGRDARMLTSVAAGALVVAGLMVVGAQAQPQPGPGGAPPAASSAPSAAPPASASASASASPPHLDEPEELPPRPDANEPEANDPVAPPPAEVDDAPVFMPPPPKEIAPPRPRLDIPLRTTLRQLVLPHGALAPSVTMLYDHPSDYTLQVPNLALSLAIGAGRNIDLDLSFTAPLDGALQSRFTFTFKAIGTDTVQVGLRPELGVLALKGADDEYAMALRPGVSVPVLFNLGNMFRIETGFSLQSFLPTDGETKAYAGFVTRSIDPGVEGPGVPFGFTFQPVEFLYLGVDSGVGLLAVRSHQSASELVGGFFMPLGFRLGGTIPLDRRPLIDVIGNFAFPYLAIGAEDPPTTRLWQLGLTARAFAAL